jgi:hypothetical protein
MEQPNDETSTRAPAIAIRYGFGIPHSNPRAILDSGIPVTHSMLGAP